MFDDRIEITNFGGLPKGLKPEDFGKKSVLRNPNIADLLHRIEYIEKMGTGISKIRKLLKDAKLLPPKFEFGTFFTVIFKRPKIKTSMETPQDKIEKFGIKNSRLKRIINIVTMLHGEEIFSIADFAVKAGVTTRVIEKDIKFLKEQSIIEFRGSRKTGKYVLTEKGKKMIKEINV